MKRTLKNISTGVMILMMLAMATGVFAEQQTMSDAVLPSVQSTDDSAQTVVSDVIGETQPEETAPTEQQSASSDADPQASMEEKVPLAGGMEPTVAVHADSDLKNLRVGDSLVLTAELSGFDGMKYNLQWQARDHGQWKDLDGEHSNALRITVTKENADWAYRAAVDTQPVQQITKLTEVNASDFRFTRAGKPTEVRNATNLLPDD